MPLPPRGSHFSGSNGRSCTCGGDFETVSEDGNSQSRRTLTSNRRSRVCKECGKRKRAACSPFLTIFSILNVILILLGAALAFAAIYTSTLDYSDVEDLRTFEYQYHLKRLMYSIAAGGVLAAHFGIFGLVAINPRVGNNSLRAIYELMLLLSAALLLVLGALALCAILIRRKVVDDHFRPIMNAYQHESTPNPFLPLHRFQAEFMCCGLSKQPDPYKHLLGTLPWSCCATFTSTVLKDPDKVQKMVEEAQKKNCTAGVGGTHDTFCDKINPGLADWAFGSGIEALGVSLYCMILLVISCAARQINVSNSEGSEYD